MRALILATISLSVLTGCDQGDPKLERGDFYSYQYQGAPFCCIYVGLNTNEAGHFSATFTNIAAHFGIHKVTKHYMAYSGGPLANYMSDHVAFFVYSVPTTYVVDRYNSLDSATREQFLEMGDWKAAFQLHYCWPTNASRITIDGHDELASNTGCIFMVSYDNQYPSNAFKVLTLSIEDAVRINWPNRAVEAFIYESNKQ
jgi:hypothetical protein